MQQDPDPGKLRNPSSFVNKYIYVGNNPVSRIDPSGMSWFSDVWSGDFTRNFGREFDSFIKNSDTQKAIILITAAVVAFYAAPVLAAMMTSTTSGFYLASTIIGAGIGGVIGGIGYNAAGVGSFNEGFFTGAMVGGVAGLSGALGYTGTLKSVGNQSTGWCLGYPGSTKFICQDFSGAVENTGIWTFPNGIQDSVWIIHFYESTPIELTPGLIIKYKYNDKANEEEKYCKISNNIKSAYMQSHSLMEFNL